MLLSSTGPRGRSWPRTAFLGGRAADRGGDAVKKARSWRTSDERRGVVRLAAWREGKVLAARANGDGGTKGPFRGGGAKTPRPRRALSSRSPRVRRRAVQQSMLHVVPKSSQDGRCSWVAAFELTLIHAFPSAKE